MASNDLKELTKKIYKEGWSVNSFTMNFENLNGGDKRPSILTTVILGKEDKQITIKSTEEDFLLHISNYDNVTDTRGCTKLKRMKRPETFNKEIVDLIDVNRSKFDSALKDVLSGNFTFSYNPTELIIGLLSTNNNKQLTKYQHLKTDYHHILAFILIQSRQLIESGSKMESKIGNSTNPLNEIFMSFIKRKNPIEDYKFFRHFLSLDLNVWNNILDGQITIMHNTLQNFIDLGKMDIEIAIPQIMSIYKQCMNLSEQFINLLRAGIEMKRGSNEPKTRLSLENNILTLKSDPQFKQIFGCLDEQIRHCDAHTSYKFDENSNMLRFYDLRLCPARITREYDINEFIEKVHTMIYTLFPAIVYSFYLNEMALLNLLLTSGEFKRLLASIGNI